ncbi:HAD-like domain-containing protein [Rhodotorula diobovata]|uniref:HAD-like domain-containing protein n=1 Tax=Rhodotorula diobovata TaxID=5288 RepID=A0A5C5FVJ2_9BASI|nr:HAD-like domain-containing protein [Rhodotorula diobovata]
MAELQASGGAGGGPSAGPSMPSPAGAGGASGEDQAQQAAQEDERRRAVMSQILSPEARERRQSIALSAPLRLSAHVCSRPNEISSAVLTRELVSVPAVSRIALVKPDRARAIEQLLMRMAQSGQLRGRVSEDQLIDVLDQMPDTAPTSHPARSTSSPSPLAGVQAVLFDQFGTLTNWQDSVVRSLADAAEVGDAGSSGAGGGEDSQVDWLAFAQRWRDGYMVRTREIAAGKPGPGNIDSLHLEILDTLLEQDEYKALRKAWSPDRRKDLCQLWHRLDAWPDTKPGLEQLRAVDPPVFLATLSNGTLRLLIDIARHNSLPLDAHFSGDLLQSYKPNPAMYTRACDLLGFDKAARQRGEVALCASHIDDLRAAAKQGLRTIYIRRATEDVNVPHGGDAVRSKSDGGEVDVVIRKIGEIAGWVRR